MKVFFFINNIPPNYGGGYLRVFKIASRFKTDRELFKIATYTKCNVYNSDYLGVTKDDIVFCNNKLTSSLFSIPWQILINRKEFDSFYVASTHWYTVVPSLVAKLIKKKVVLGVTLSMVDSPAIQARNILKKLYYRFKTSQFKWADYIFVNSPLLVDECLKCGYDTNVVKLINNPVDISKFRPASIEEKIELKKSLGIDNGYPIILFVGSINKRKGCDLFAEIFRRVFDQLGFRLNFVICGQKGYPETNLILEELQSVFKNSGSSLFVNEEVSDTSIYYKIADLFLFPTTNEGMPNVVLEAMACGCMILCNHLYGITDYALSKDFLIENNNISSYVEKIVAYLKEPDNYRLLIDSNRKIIKESFTQKSVDESIKLLLSKDL